MDFNESFFAKYLALSQREYIFVTQNLSATSQTTLISQVFDFVVEYLADTTFCCNTLQKLFDLLISSWQLCLYAFTNLEFTLPDDE